MRIDAPGIVQAAAGKGPRHRQAPREGIHLKEDGMAETKITRRAFVGGSLAASALAALAA